jgi:hypothetical protein
VRGDEEPSVRSCGHGESEREREREREKWRASTLTPLRCSCGGCSTVESSDAAARRATELGNGSSGASSQMLGFRAAEAATAG